MKELRSKKTFLIYPWIRHLFFLFPFSANQVNVCFYFRVKFTQITVFLRIQIARKLYAVFENSDPKPTIPLRNSAISEYILPIFKIQWVLSKKVVHNNFIDFWELFFYVISDITIIIGNFLESEHES